MDELRGVIFDYGHTLVWFPKYEEAHLVAARNVQRALLGFGISIDVSRVRTLMDSFALRRDDTSASAEEEARGILVSVGVINFQQHDLLRIADAQWKPYVEYARIRKGVKETLHRLRTMGLKLGIVANIWSGGMNPVLGRLGIEEFFDTTIADMDVGFAKPNPKIFRLALDNLRLTPKQALMVGDNPKTDIKGAYDLGISTVRLMRGPNRTQPDCVEPNFRIRNFSTLVSIAQRLIHT
jgi:HAD superfamily hydrolase (TIGR01509 family)